MCKGGVSAVSRSERTGEKTEHEWVGSVFAVSYTDGGFYASFLTAGFRMSYSGKNRDLILDFYDAYRP